MKRAVALGVLLTAGAISGVWIESTRSLAEHRLRLARAALNDGITRTVVVGDSVARGAGDERHAGIAGALSEQLKARGLGGVDVLNLGINGARTTHVLRLLSTARAKSAVRTADVVVVSIGGNDLYGDSRARLFAGLAPNAHQDFAAGRVARVVAQVRVLNPAARVFVLGLYNPYQSSNIRPWLDQQVNRWDARLINRFASWHSVTVVRITDLLAARGRLSRNDGFHPGAAGYAAIAARIASAF